MNGPPLCDICGATVDADALSGVVTVRRNGPQRSTIAIGLCAAHFGAFQHALRALHLTEPAAAAP